MPWWSRKKVPAWKDKCTIEGHKWLSGPAYRAYTSDIAYGAKNFKYQLYCERCLDWLEVKEGDVMVYLEHQEPITPYVLAAQERE